MRREHIQAVSSALLLTLVVFIPHHIDSPTGPSGIQALGLKLGPMISEFYPRGLCNDEYVVLSNTGDSDVNLRSWNLTDGEGRLMFNGDLWMKHGSSLAISWNRSSFSQAYGRPPEVSMDMLSSSGVVSTSGIFRLGDSGDSVALIDPGGAVTDAVIYGVTNDTWQGWAGEPVPLLRPGEVAKRIRCGGSFLDTNTRNDWMPFREFRYGYTELPGGSVDVASGNITAFTSPDNSLDVILQGIASAKYSIRACSYEFSSVPVTEALIKAGQRGIDVQLLVDGLPYGGMSSEEISCLSVLAMSGIDVRAMKGNVSADAVQHVAALHAKYMVLDSESAIVLSENFVEQGVPSDRVFGNRGWGVEIRDPSVAAIIGDIFMEDSRLSRVDVNRWQDDFRFNRSAAMPPAPIANHTQELFEPMVTSEPARVTIYPSPDASTQGPYLAQMIENARYLDCEQFQADLFWKGRWVDSPVLSPLVSSVESSLKSGGSVRLLLDSSWYNVPGNGEVINSLRENATFAGMDGRFEFINSSSPITTLHNKGAVMDHRAALITSNNWVFSSFARNRELGVLVDSVEVADYFSTIFAADWYPDDTPPVADAGQDVELTVNESVELSSARSYDDRLISSVSWDTNGDGVSESSNRTVTFTPAFVGSYHVILRVTDAWGNAATDEVIINVSSGQRAPRSGIDGLYDLGWAIPVLVAGAYLALRSRTRGVAPEPPRKVNHRPKA